MANRCNKIACILVLFLILIGTASHAAIIYVDPAGGGTQSGLDWRNPMPTIQQGIEACRNAGGGEAWVKAGTYCQQPG